MSDWYLSRWPVEPAAPYFSPEEVQAMTHQPEQRNPAAPILDALRKFYQGGLSEVLKGTRYQLPDWSDAIGNILQSEAANTAMGVMTPLKGTGIRMGIPEASELRPAANLNKSQAEIKGALPPPKSFMDRIWDNYAQRMTPDEFLQSEPLWGGARRLAEARGISESEAFAEIANEIFGRMGANKFLTPQAARSYMGAQRGIASVVPAEPDVLPRAVGRSYDPNRPINPQTLQEMRGYENPETITSAATKIGDKIYPGQTHATAFSQAEDELKLSGKVSSKQWQGLLNRLEEGFLTSRGRFVSRTEADKIASQAEQLNKTSPYYAPGSLASESLGGRPINEQTLAELAALLKELGGK